MRPSEDPNVVVDRILSRRSVRRGFDGRTIPRDQLETVVACGLSAPSSKNAQPWRFHVVQDRELMVAIAVAAEHSEDVDRWVPSDPRTGLPHGHWPSSVRESADILRSAAVGILIENRGVFSGGRQVLANATPTALAASLLGYSFELVGIGAALENMWLAANSLGISAAFLGDLAIAESTARQLLAFEGDMVGILVLGYSDLTSDQRRPSPAETQTVAPVMWR